jgi:imidazolonepropionase-like amidohydrolase
MVPPGAVDYFDHMPIGYQRAQKQAMVDASDPRDDQAYRAALDHVLETMKLLHRRGVLIVPGTDLGGSFAYHRELELFQRIGMTPAEVLSRATLEMARYLGQDQSSDRSSGASWPTSSWSTAIRRWT